MKLLFENWREYIGDDRLDESVVSDMLQNVDDLLDQAIQEAAPEIVRNIREREVDEDVDEFIDGAIHGAWESKTQAYADPPNIGDPVEVMDEGDKTEVTEMYRLGYEWGWENPDKAREDIPPEIKRRMVEEAIEEFQGRITEEVLIDALEKSVDWAKHSLDDVHTILKNAKEKYGWKLVPAIAGIEVFEHAVLPQALVALTGNPAFYVVATIPTIEILAATALAIAKSKLPKEPEPEPEPGHLDWYEKEQPSANLFENWRKFLSESKLRVFDFDDTLAITDARVKLTLADGSEVEQTPAEFAVYEPGPGESYAPDAFVQFENVSDPREIKQVTNILRNIVAAGNEDRNVAVLTARPHEAGTGIAKFLEDIGIPAGAVEIVTLASSLPEDKRRWIQDRIDRGATDVEFFDDSPKNVQAVQSLKDEYPGIRIRTRLIKYGESR